MPFIIITIVCFARKPNTDFTQVSFITALLRFINKMFVRFPQVLILSCVTVYLLERVTSSEVMRQKRSDDREPLEAVVEQLSQQVTSLSAEVTALKAKTGKLV